MTVVVFSEECDVVVIARNAADVGVQRISFDPLTLATQVPYLHSARVHRILSLIHI